jgi:SAM-dependent methyltransferase
MLSSIEHFLILLTAQPIGECFNYLLSEAPKHFSYLHERLYSQPPANPSLRGFTLDEIESSTDLNKRLETFEGHGLAVVLSDALINIVTSLNRELEAQYWMGYWDIATNKSWQQMVLKETGARSPIPFPIKTQAEYSQFYASQTMNNAGGVSAKTIQCADQDLYHQLTQHPTDHAFRLATSICQIKMLLVMLQERHPHEVIRWLDVGCGIGYIANRVGWEGEFVGIDVADALIDYANETRFSDRYQYIAGGFEEARNAIGGKKFHLITATEVVEHIFDPLDFVEQMKSHTCDMIYASSPLLEAVPTQPSREHLWSFSLESYEQLFKLSAMKIAFSSSMNVGSFIGEGHNWLSVAATKSDVLRVWLSTESR